MINRLLLQHEQINHSLVFAAIPIALQKFPIFIQQIITYSISQAPEVQFWRSLLKPPALVEGNWKSPFLRGI